MWSRVTYTARETWASFQRNVTLTAAAIITAAVSLLLFGLTLLIQRAFDNQLTLWEEGVEMVVYVNPGVSDEQRSVVEQALSDQEGTIVESSDYCNSACSMDVAETVLAGNPDILSSLNEDNIPTFYRVTPTEASDSGTLSQLRISLLEEPNVMSVQLAEDEIEVIETLKDVFGRYSIALSVALLLAAVLLIWNTIRTAMYARRREIEVMKLVGATNWFIRLPFMLEGLVQGMLGGLLASGTMYWINEQWSSDVKDFPDTLETGGSGFSAMVVDDPAFVGQRMLLLVIVGAIVGAIGSGVAVSRWLDV